MTTIESLDSLAAPQDAEPAGREWLACAIIPEMKPREKPFNPKTPPRATPEEMDEVARAYHVHGVFNQVFFVVSPVSPEFATFGSTLQSGSRFSCERVGKQFDPMTTAAPLKVALFNPKITHLAQEDLQSFKNGQVRTPHLLIFQQKPNQTQNKNHFSLFFSKQVILHARLASNLIVFDPTLGVEFETALTTKFPWSEKVEIVNLNINRIASPLFLSLFLAIHSFTSFTSLTSLTSFNLFEFPIHIPFPVSRFRLPGLRIIDSITTSPPSPQTP